VKWEETASYTFLWLLDGGSASFVLYTKIVHKFITSPPKLFGRILAPSTVAYVV
jgi:hypothetical protein